MIAQTILIHSVIEQKRLTPIKSPGFPIVLEDDEIWPNLLVKFESL